MAGSRGSISHDNKAVCHKCFQDQTLPSLQDIKKVDTLVFFYKVDKKMIVGGLYLTIRWLCDTTAFKTKPYYHHRTDERYRLTPCSIRWTRG